MTSRLFYFALYVLVACGPEPGSDTDTATDSDTSGASTTAASSTAPTTGPVPEGELCGCEDASCHTSICDAFVVGCEWEPCDPELWWAVTDESALGCAVKALRDRKPGLVEWSRNFGFDTGTAERLLVRIREDGTVSHVQLFPSRCQGGPITHFALADAGYFEGCLAEPDALARFLCMDAGFRERLAECGEAPALSCESGPSGTE
ncbi:hypothetical protein SAMN02745121_08027 [Nannocystis exedens]|uniref:Uncharacterized protein n=1 Tax=Nannocystis exedens TaxID=54 RepID=A0A1I2HM76_9BACT|nr:hypothetical protein [Nannocystis exedens]PCC71994.1 hypothetical protein NAEX_05073 [Nannocystis exedens]SFF30370.1 hypothetical protein SAMN02745121_08027 [Nannocystis exedens]